MKASWAAVLLLCVTACSSGKSVSNSCGTGDVSSATSAIVNGLPVSQYLKLSTTQLAAVGSVRPFDMADEDYCSGVAVSRDWVMTAHHCAWSPGLVFIAAGVKIDVTEQVAHPDLDILLLKLAEPLPASVTPIHVLSSPLLAQDRSRFVEIAGTGTADAGVSDGTRVAVSTILKVDSSYISVGSAGLTGACDGDSGGPLLLRDEDASVAVVGVLSYGSVNCLGSDFYARADIARDWLTGIVGPPGSEDQSCQGLDNAGLCDGQRALWCNSGAALVTRCADACGWDAAASGYRCVPKIDENCAQSCGFGSCAGGVAHYCEHDVSTTEDCSVHGQQCGFSPESGHVACLAAPP